MRISDWSSDVCSSDLNQAWPVFLGRARFDPEDNPTLAADPSGRRYGGVRAERVEAPSGTATLELGLGPDGASHVAWHVAPAPGERQSGGEGTGVSVRCVPGGVRFIKNKNTTKS